MHLFCVAGSLAGLLSAIHASPSKQSDHIRFHLPKRAVKLDSLHNIHIEYLTSDFQGDLQMHYGDCKSTDVDSIANFVGRTEIRPESRPERFVWIVPANAMDGGCLHAISGRELVGKSDPITIQKASFKKRESIANVADTSGPWFEGVAYMKSKTNDDAFVAAEKNKTIAIIGGGMAGLMTSLLLQSVGIENWEIMESSQRVGGRIRTKYLNGTKPADYQYQEMGPMRFPVSVTYPETNDTLEIRDHQMVFQLGEKLNELNGNDSELAVNFIPWLQHSKKNLWANREFSLPTDSHGGRLPDGTIPSSEQIAANSTLRGKSQTSANATEEAIASASLKGFRGMDVEYLRAMGLNIYKAHKKAEEKGLFDFSMAGYLRYVQHTTWKTIDKGLESLPKAFMPLIQNRTTFGRFVSGLEFKKDSRKIAVNWRDANHELDMIPESKDFDYAIVAAPFSKVRTWKLPPYSSLLSRAISRMKYQSSCKIALHYKTRFWEHLANPIFGGCGSTDIAGQGSVCYPSYKINSTGPGVILGSYASGTICDSVETLSTTNHVALIQRAMVEIHGPIAAEQWTGNFERQLWGKDEHQAGAWASPIVGQQDLYLPAYYQTEFNTIFIGEHTSYTHAWVFSALDSAVRGTTQLLLDIGLVDEAKEVVETWMGRWITL
ncbi:hypothetical protein HYALB_00008197 [Hymenoscyphus albidus]|uniref:Amine oxidase domain-containing protein n=1 Tax=Hymenoscyphus albidus TaxID=595503 RepID=A0A9N9Q029_9HELO|nr:hypothetical protein HYALB_00008197 [Hymenoscyphus albidus]